MSPVSAPSSPNTAGPLGLLEHRRHNTRAVSASLRFWARTIGEKNRRYVDQSYVSPFGGAGAQAHPCWLYSVHDTIVARGDGRVPVLAGTTWSFERPVLPGEDIFTTARLVGERVVDGRFAGETPVQTIVMRYCGAHGEEVATATSTIFLIAPEEARRRDKFANWRRWRYDAAQLGEIERASDLESSRYAQREIVRYAEDVRLGEILTPQVRGPLTSEEVTLYIGATRPAQGVELFTADRVAGNVASFVHPKTGVFETYDAGFIDDESAQQLGFPAAHDPGSDRVSYLASLVTGWMGPAGDIRSLSVQLREPHMLGDTSWCRGLVSEVMPCSPTTVSVVIKLEIRNQADLVTTTGSATVELPRRDISPAP